MTFIGLNPMAVWGKSMSKNNAKSNITGQTTRLMFKRTSSWLLGQMTPFVSYQPRILQPILGKFQLLIVASVETERPSDREEHTISKTLRTLRIQFCLPPIRI